MACACKKKKVGGTFVYTSPTGKTTVYKSETEAKYAVARKGGSYKPGK
jgi:hypothetical protein